MTFPSSGGGPTAAPAGWSARHSSLRSRERSEAREVAAKETPKKSISMGQIKGQSKQDVNGNTGDTYYYPYLPTFTLF